MLNFKFEQTVVAKVTIEGLDKESLTKESLARLNDTAHRELCNDGGAGHEFLVTVDGWVYRGQVEPEVYLGWDYDRQSDEEDE